MKANQRLWVKPVLVLAFATLLGLLLGVQASLSIDAQRRAVHELEASGQLDKLSVRPDPWEVTGLALLECYIWVGLTPAIFFLGRRFPIDQGRWRRSLLFHIPVCLVAAVIEITVSATLNHLLRRGAPTPFLSVGVAQLFFLLKLPSGVLLYWFILGISQALAYYHKYRDRELRASQLEARLAQSQLQVLKMQLHPHFLFNTLNAISALIHEDVEVADRMIARLGELLRATLEQASVQEVPLRQELDFIRPYLEIEQARMGERLTVAMEIDPEAMDACVPNLLLQPLVENAIRHGIAPRSDPGRIDIRARRAQALLELQVSDDGPGLSPAQHACLKEGVGVANTRARLEQLYGPAQHFVMSNGDGRGLTVTVTIPFREHAARP